MKSLAEGIKKTADLAVGASNTANEAQQQQGVGRNNRQANSSRKKVSIYNRDISP